MLSGLGDDFDPMIMAIESSGANITSDYVRSLLVQYEKKQSSENQKALATTKVQKPKNKKKFVPKCFKCKQLGHRAFECPEKQEKQSSTEKNSLALALQGVNRNEWLIDSGASAHMTMREDWLYDKVAKSKEITVANNHKILSQSCVHC